MDLMNRNNHAIFHVTTVEDDNGFCIYAQPRNHNISSFCMHYRSLEEFNEEWDDI